MEKRYEIASDETAYQIPGKSFRIPYALSTGLKEKNPVLLVLFGALSLIGLYLTSLYSYLLFHSLAEMFSIIIACGIFMVTWNSRRFLDNMYLLFIGIAYLFVAVLDIMHALSYKDMGVFQGYDANLPTQFWISARYLESLSLLIAPFILGRRLKINIQLFIYVASVSLLLGSIFYWEVFPVCFIEGVGLTPFKKISECVISLILFCSIAVLWKRRIEFDEDVLRLLIVSIILTIMSELAFTFYVSVYGISNLIGHFLKIISFYLIYRAIIVTGMNRPYDLLFRNLKKNNDALQEARDELEQQVSDCAREIVNAKKDLQKLAGRLISNQEKEMQRLSRELHDDLTQQLAVVAIDAGNIIEQYKELPPSVILTLSYIKDRLIKVSKDVHRMSRDLHPSILHDLGLFRAIKSECSNFSSRMGIAVMFTPKNVPDAVPNNIALTVYRIIQEGLSNIAKYANTKNAYVFLESKDNSILLTVRDAGTGFDPAKVKQKAALGLGSIRERVRLVNGTFSITSKPGKGTSIEVKIPLKNDDELQITNRGE